MIWYNTGESLPEDDSLVIIKLKYKNPFFTVAKFLSRGVGLKKDYKNIFIISFHPYFPKPWLFTEQYFKISRIPKSKVEKWAYLIENEKPQERCW
jgi:hypothetical protein